MVQDLRNRSALYRQLAEQLRAEILSGRWKLGEQLPTESQLVEEYRMSRATVRQALSVLEHEGYLVTRHGSGRFVSRPEVIVSSGIEQLKSITSTIAEQGFKPGMRSVEKEWRPAEVEEAELLGIEPESEVLALKREITADKHVVAFSHDVISASLLPSDLDLRKLKGSVFEFLEEVCGVAAKTSYARVHAVHDPSVGWGLDEDADRLFVLLDQTHFSAKGEPILYSRTYFIEGRFNFSVVRTR